eukprot:gene7883-16139_t
MILDQNENPSKSPDKVLKELNGVCLDFIRQGEWWAYKWCYKQALEQFHMNPETQKIEHVNLLGTYIESESSRNRQVFRSTTKDCLLEGSTLLLPRSATVELFCCIDTNENGPTVTPPVSSPSQDTPDLYGLSVNEPKPCTYELVVCYKKLCSNEDLTEYQKQQSRRGTGTRSSTSSTSRQIPSLGLPAHTKGAQPAAKKRMPSQQSPQTQDRKPWTERGRPSEGEGEGLQREGGRLPLLSPDGKLAALERVRAMFHHAYDSYMEFAYPEGELRPVSCSGGPFELVKLPLVTLIDTLDTLVVMGNHSEFRHAVSLVEDQLPSFDMDVNVSVFETTIRVLGGLLSAHLFAG